MQCELWIPKPWMEELILVASIFVCQAHCHYYFCNTSVSSTKLNGINFLKWTWTKMKKKNKIEIHLRQFSSLDSVLLPLRFTFSVSLLISSCRLALYWNMFFTFFNFDSVSVDRVLLYNVQSFASFVFIKRFGCVFCLSNIYFFFVFLFFRFSSARSCGSNEKVISYIQQTTIEWELCQQVV